MQFKSHVLACLFRQRSPFAMHSKERKESEEKDRLTFCCGLPCPVSRILCWSPSRALLTMSSHLHLLLLLFLLLRGSFGAFRRTPWRQSSSRQSRIWCTSEDPVLRGRDKNPRRSRGKIATRLHRAGYTHDETPRDANNEGERAEKGWEGREGGGKTGTAAKSDRNAPRVAKFLTISMAWKFASRLVTHDRNITEDNDRGTWRCTQFSENRNAFTHRLKCDYTGRFATTRDSRGTNHHRLLTSGPPATLPTSVHSDRSVWRTSR